MGQGDKSPKLIFRIASTIMVSSLFRKKRENNGKQSHYKENFKKLSLGGDIHES